MEETVKIIKEIENYINIRLNRNQYRETARLVYEIIKYAYAKKQDIFSSLHAEFSGKTIYGRNKFLHLKKILVKLRFPSTSHAREILPQELYLPQNAEYNPSTYHPKGKFSPEKIFVEESVKNSGLEKNFARLFPEVKIEHIPRISFLRKNLGFSLQEFKKPYVFIVKENWDFIKPCPCTKGHLGCGYWILNLGFGCPFDCSYCYLQQYQNFPGIILPANLDDFFLKTETFLKKIGKPVRIGTGEFCDSLALDHITGYSRKLVPFFSQKNVFFELKTKSTNIKNLLEMNPARNIIISWSLNPQSIAEKEEINTPSLKEKLKAARTVQEKGYSLAFHFDPIIPVENWQALYQETIELLYSYTKAPFAWISLGTLRCNRELKVIVEKRYHNSSIFSGELLLGRDKKLRYPEFIKTSIYKEMFGWIRERDSKTPVYLCMEDKDTWQKSIMPAQNTREIENYLIKNNLYRLG